MELDRKAFHFDLDNESVKRFYTTERPEQGALEKAPAIWSGLSLSEMDDCFSLSSYFVAPQEEHLYPVVTVSSHALLTSTCSSHAALSVTVS